MPSQKSLTDQLNDLITLGDKAGLYDATDYIRSLQGQPFSIGATVKFKGMTSVDAIKGRVVPVRGVRVRWDITGNEGSYDPSVLEKVDE